MRVLFLTPSVRPLGARRSLVELVRHLPPQITPLVVCPSEEGIYLELKDLGVDVAVAPQGAWRKFTGRLTALFRQIPRIQSQVRKFSPDVIHANEFHIVPQAFFSAGKKVPISGHVRLSITPRQFHNYHIPKVRRLIVVSSAVKGLLAGTGMEDRIRVVYNGVNVGKVGEPGDPIPEVSPWWGNGGNRPLVVGLFGLISARKNQLVAAEAVSLANKRGADVRLLLAGDAHKSSIPYGEELRARLAQDDLKDKAIWVPFQKEIAPLYRSIDLNLLISSEEGFGRTIIEAGAAGRPSIGTKIGGIPELIQPGETGWLVDEGNPDQIADLLVKVWSDGDMCRKMGEAAREMVGKTFTIEAHTRRMIEVWEECRDEGPVAG
ncbi:MAG: glycosyltransferase family 4 protein [Candidatus Sumerlaeia bacterium]|nr:glycosyltransferase family 4 protein [Candidatus Sumerlaeia bacterium]